MTGFTTALVLGLLGVAVAGGPARAAAREAAPAADAILAALAAMAKAQKPEFAGFSAKRGDAFYHADHEGGRAPSCTTCHNADPRHTGTLPNGVTIPPLAVSANPRRMSDKDRYLGQIRGCCNITLGHDCTAADKGDVTEYLLGQ